MYPILARYGPFFLYSYTVVMGLGVGTGLALTFWLERRQSWAKEGWFDPLIVALMSALIGGRIVYIWINSDYFREQPDETVLLWLGGLNYHGALLAGLAVAWGWHIWRGDNFLQFAGLLAPGFAMVQVFGWVACWLEGCAYGTESGIVPLSGDLPDEYGVYALRYRTQEIGFLISLVALGIALWLHGRARPGIVFWFTLAALSAGRLVTSLLRGDEMMMIGSWRLDSTADGILLVASIAGISYMALRRRHLNVFT